MVPRERQRADSSYFSRFPNIIRVSLSEGSTRNGAGREPHGGNQSSCSHLALCGCPLSHARHQEHIHDPPSHLSSVTEPRKSSAVPPPHSL